MAKALLLALPVLSATAAATAAEHDLCEPKAYEMALRYQQKSAEIMALQLQTYRFATERFNEKLKDLKTPENYAVVMDLDETVLDNTLCWCATWSSVTTIRNGTPGATGRNRKTRLNSGGESVS
jgi:predicted secreted acid phosphatase